MACSTSTVQYNHALFSWPAKYSGFSGFVPVAHTIDYEETNMAWKSKIRKKVTTQGLIRLSLGVLAAFLLHPMRFSETVIKIGGLKANDILKELQTNNIAPSKDPYQEKCEVDMDYLRHWKQPSSTLEDQDLPLVKGGRWKPEHCQPRFDSKFCFVFN